jgi:1-phosphofructokinase family hexose kinase
MILTVTLNPALDRLVFVENLEWYGKNIARETHTFACGKGFTVAKGLGALAIDTTALGFVGLADVDFYRQALEPRGIQLAIVPIARTRTNIKLIEADKGRETEINERGAGVLPEQLEQLRREFTVLVTQSRFVTLSGSLAPGVPTTIYAELVTQALRHNVRAVVDASGAPLRLAIQAHPFALRLNVWELEEVAEHTLPSTHERLAAAKSLLSGGTEFVVVSSGAEGAMLIHETGTWSAHAPQVKVVNAIGSGDVMTAALIDGWMRGDTPEVTLKWATALASASAMTFESGEVDVRVARELMGRVTVEQIS